MDTRAIIALFLLFCVIASIATPAFIRACQISSGERR